MGKRKHHDEEEYLARKMRKLERKMTRVRRKQRYRSPSSSSFSNGDRYPDSDYYQHLVPQDCDNSAESLQEAPQSEGAPNINSTDNIVLAQPGIPGSEGTTVPMTAPINPRSIPGLAAVIVPVSTSTPKVVDADVPASAAAGSAQMEIIHELDPDILCLLGEEPVREEKFGANVHKDIATRWSDLLVNGLKDDTRNGILKGYNVPDNLKLIQAPTLNPEIKAAVNESALKRDVILAEKQRLLSSVLTCLANTITSVLTTATDSSDAEIKCQTLKSLSDAGRLLCHVHYNETQTRRNFLLTCLSKEIKDNVKNLKRDHLLFGNDLQENLKSMKAIVRTGAELKSTAAKPKLPPKNKQPEPSTSRALNWRGPPPPQPHPRRMPARPSSTTGGRKQLPARRATDRRAPQQRSRTSRR